MTAKNFSQMILLTFLLVGCTAQQIQQAKKTLEEVMSDESYLTSEQIANGLKEALVQGTSKGTRTVSQLNGYYKNPQIKIPFPPDVQNVAERLRAIGMGDQVDQFIQTLNRGAEQAAKEAGPILLNAVKSMSIEDAWDVLKGEDNAATQYLKRTASSDLESAFKPVVRKALDQTKATMYYKDLVTAYNKIPGVDDVNPELDHYATQKALDGLFFMLEKEERNIRNNPVARSTDLLKKVFSQQD